MYNTTSERIYNEESSARDNVRPCVACDELPNSFSSLSVLHLNAGTGGLRKPGQLELLSDLLRGEGNSIDAVVVSELWLRSADFECYGIPDFCFVAAGRETGARGGGVGVFVRSNCSVLSSVSVSSTDGNVQVVKVRVRKMALEGCIIGMYSSNYCHSDTLLETLERVIPDGSNIPCVLLGDSNVDLRSKSRSERYCGFLAGRGYRQLISGVTRPASGTCLDHIAIRDCDGFLEISSFIWNTPIFSDHFPVMVHFTGLQSGAGGSIGGRDSAYVRRHSREDIDHFASRIGALSWDEFDAIDDVDNALDLFCTALRGCYETCFPMVEGSAVKGANSDFNFGPGLRRLRANVNKMFRWYRKMGTPEAKSKYYKSLSRFRGALNKSRRSFFSRKCRALRGDPAKMWNLINRTCGRGREKASLPALLAHQGGTVDTPSGVADVLNRHRA